MKKITIVLLLAGIFTLPAWGQEEGAPAESKPEIEEDQKKKEKPCTDPRASQFDFWVGEWNLTWGQDKNGTNKIERVMDGCVIEENFNGNPGYPNYVGKSWSVFDPKKAEWKQTWVDNQGGYLDFTGKMEGDKMILSRTTVEGWTQTKYRMIYHNITENSLDWSWEKFNYETEKWEVKWAIHYERAETDSN